MTTLNSLPFLSEGRKQLTNQASHSPGRGNKMAENCQICMASTNNSQFQPDEAMLTVTL
jgi:hypothetical protein